MSTMPPTAVEVADRYVFRLAAWDRTAAQALGARPVVLVPDLSPEAFAARHDLARAAVRELSTVEDSVLASAMTERLASDIALHDAGFTTRLLAPLATPVHEIRQVFADLSHDAEGLAENLAQVPAALSGYTETLRAAAGRGHVAPLRQVLVVAGHCESWVDDFRALDQPAAAAFAAFATFLREELALLAPRADAAGRELYEVTAQAFLGAQVDLDELYDFGWAELRRLDSQLSTVATEIDGDGLPAAIAWLDRDPRYRLSGTDALLGWLRERVAAATDALDGPHFDIPARTRTVECRLAPSTAGIMYYTAPDPALTRPGRVWWSVPGDPARIATWREVSTLHHESLPGHHLQHAITMTLPNLHPWQRLLCQVHGYAEGWAHYAEGLADELGLIHDPGERLGMLLDKRWRAARVVIDLGLHLGLPIPRHNGITDADAWSPELAREVLVRTAGVDPATARFEVDRYLGWPGQALSFAVGARLWREARAASASDRKTFHAKALRLGPMGLDPLRAALAGA